MNSYSPDNAGAPDRQRAKPGGVNQPRAASGRRPGRHKELKWMEEDQADALFLTRKSETKPTP